MDAKRKSYTPEFKLKVVLESMQRDTTQEEVCKKFGISSSMIHRWRQGFQTHTASIFHDKSLGVDEEVTTAQKVELAHQLCQPHGPYSKSQVVRALSLARGTLYLKSKQATKDKQVATAIEQWHEQDDTMGHRKLAVLLKMSKNRVKRVMNTYGIEARRRKKRYFSPGKARSIVPNLVRDPKLPVEQEVMFSDIFEVQLADRTKVRGCFALWKRTRHILALAFDDSMRADLVVSTIEMVKFGVPGTIWYSDQGSQYGAEQTRAALLLKGFERSMSQAGTPTDNGYAERFVGQFKLSVAQRQPYRTLGDCLQAAEAWVNFYNQKRPHEGLDQRSPDQYAREHGLLTAPYLPLL